MKPAAELAASFTQAITRSANLTHSSSSAPQTLCVMSESSASHAGHTWKLDPGHREPDPEALHNPIGGVVIGLAALHQLFDGHSARGTKRPQMH